MNKKEWVELTEAELVCLLQKVDPYAKRLPLGYKMFAKEVQDSLKEKNSE